MKYNWIGEERELPKFGVFREGDSLELPDDIGKDLERQGLVKKAKADKKEKGE
jgi:hypothetical protein